MSRFAAIDFETANNARDSACALGVVIVEHGRMVDRLYELIHPPSREFLFTHIHGLSWDEVKGAQRFDAVWADLARELAGVAFLAAHNAPFDKGVLGACCATYQLAAPSSGGFGCGGVCAHCDRGAGGGMAVWVGVTLSHSYLIS